MMIVRTARTAFLTGQKVVKGPVILSARKGFD